MILRGTAPMNLTSTNTNLGLFKEKNMEGKEIYEHEFSGLLTKFEEVCTWFDSLGFRFAVTRYGVYHKNLQKLKALSNGEKIFKDTPDENLVAFMKEMMNSHVEANKIIRVYNDLKWLDIKEYLDQIKKVITGQEFRATSENDPARDFLFELSMAARFLRAGYKISLKSICDIEVKLSDGKILFVECKRVKSLKKLSKNIKVANQQIVRRIKDSSSLKNLGMVAVNVTDLLPNLSLINSEDARMAISEHRELSRNFILRNLEDFMAGENKKCIGVLCESSLSKLCPRGLIYSRHINNIPYESDELFERLMPQLSNQDIA